MSTLIDKIQVDAAKKFATIEKETKKKAESHDKNIKVECVYYLD